MHDLSDGVQSMNYHMEDQRNRIPLYLSIPLGIALQIDFGLVGGHDEYVDKSYMPTSRMRQAHCITLQVLPKWPPWVDHGPMFLLILLPTTLHP